jgi:hypothetical protein
VERRYPLGRRGLAWVLLGLLLVSWFGQFVFEIVVVRNEAHAHGEAFSWGEFWPEFGQSTLENWQSEFLQLLTFVVLTTFLVFQGSPESRDGDDEVKSQLNRIEAKLDGTWVEGPNSL